MTRGALIFAFNNEQTDYLAMARWSAERIHRHLNIPVAVVTNQSGPGVAEGFDEVIHVPGSSGGTRYFEDYDQTVTWYNAGRVDAFNLTPWDHTLVLDADYVVCSDHLNRLWYTNTDFLCHKNAWDAKNGKPLDGLNTSGRGKMPMWWATVMCFKRTNFSQYVFDAMTMVRENWQHYRDLYQIDRATYRNDFALSIALGIVSGHTNTVDEIPWDLASALPDTELEHLDNDYFSMRYKDSNGVLRSVGISGTDFHAMGKRHLENIIASR
jgi:hypothetical protein